MKKSTLFLNFFKTIVITLLAIKSLDFCNIFDYIKVPEEYVFEGGLAVNYAFINLIIDVILNTVSSKYITVSCIFSDKAGVFNVTNTPSIVCKNDVCTVYYKLECKGNSQILKKFKLCLDVPQWLDAQINCNEIAEIESKKIIWNLNNFANQQNNEFVYEGRLSFIVSDFEDKLTYKLTLNKSVKFIIGLFVRFEHNSFIIQNKE